MRSADKHHSSGNPAAPARLAIAAILVSAAAAIFAADRAASPAAHKAAVSATKANWTAAVEQNATSMFREGQLIFRFDTFGDEVYWTDTLRLHEAIEGSKHGGVGKGVSPKTALSVGLKVDSAALPAAVVDGIKKGKVDLDDPATTLTLIKLNAVLGVQGKFNADGSLKSIGLTCAVCHSTVDDSFAPGIGRRLDGWANRDLNSGAIISLSPGLNAISKTLGVDDATTRKVLASWGPGKFDAVLNLDGKAFRPDGKAAATLIPPAFGMAGVNMHTWTGGWGTVTYWNAYVANLELGGQGTFFDRRLMNAEQYPVAAKNGLGNKRSAVDKITAKLGALHFYQLALPTPKPAETSFDKTKAAQGAAIFVGKAQCATCHVPPLFTEPGWNTHPAADIGIDDFQASRSPERTYRTAPLRGLWTHSKGGYYHDGRFATLNEVVNHYDTFKNLGLSESEKAALVEYLKSL
ncbi:MAG: di-heme oxidoredictase family protein [Acidobacteriota bacterium]